VAEDAPIGDLGKISLEDVQGRPADGGGVDPDDRVRVGGDGWLGDVLPGLPPGRERSPAQALTGRARVARIAGPIHDRLVVYVLVAAVAGLLAPDAASRLSAGVPYMLAGQVLGVALTLTVGQFATVARRPLPVLLALGAQWTVLPLAGVALLHAGGSADLRDGALIVAVAPAEITSALVALLAGGSGAVATLCMAGSLLLGTVLTPLWVSAVLGPGAHVDGQTLILELALAVALPLIIGVGLRTSLPGLGRLRSRALDLSAISVVLVVFVSVGSARTLLFSTSLLEGLALCAILLLAGYALGLVIGRPWRRDAHLTRALLFPVAMREFGIAATVALAVSPRSLGFIGLYGLTLMVTAPTVARLIRP